MSDFPSHRPSARLAPVMRTSLLVLAVLFTSACQNMVPASWKIPATQHPAPISTRSTLDAADLFSYTKRILALGREELNEEITTRRERATTTRSALDRAKLAVALTLPNQGQRDTTKALLAITDVPRDDPSLDPQAMVVISYVEALLAWQARQEEALQALLQEEHVPPPTVVPTPSPSPELASLQALAQNLRADQKRNESQIDALSGKLREEKARADSLQQKLDALSNLEKSLADRKPGRTDTPR